MRGKKNGRSDRSERRIDASINTIYFSVNYARRLGFIVGESWATHKVCLRATKERIKRKKVLMTHILLFPPGSVVTFTKLIKRRERRVRSNHRYIPQRRRNEDIPTIVENAFLSSAFRRLFLLLLIYFWCRCLYFSRTSERAVN